MNQRAHQRHKFDFFVLEHRPEGGQHPQATRTLVCKDFSKGGLRLEGTPRYEEFKATISSPHDDTKFDVDLKVVHQSEGWFGVRFISPSDALIEKLSWWDAPSRPLPSQDLGQSAGIDA